MVGCATSSLAGGHCYAVVARADQPLTDGNHSALVAWAVAAHQALAPLTGGRGPRGWVMAAQGGAVDNAAFPSAMCGNGPALGAHAGAADRALMACQAEPKVP